MRRDGSMPAYAGARPRILEGVDSSECCGYCEKYGGGQDMPATSPLVYATDSCYDIYRFDPVTGRLGGLIPAGTLVGTPADLTFDAAGNLYYVTTNPVTHPVTGQSASLWSYTPDGTLRWGFDVGQASLYSFHDGTDDQPYGPIGLSRILHVHGMLIVCGGFIAESNGTKAIEYDPCGKPAETIVQYTRVWGVTTAGSFAWRQGGSQFEAQGQGEPAIDLVSDGATVWVGNNNGYDNRPNPSGTDPCGCGGPYLVTDSAFDVASGSLLYGANGPGFMAFGGGRLYGNGFYGSLCRWITPFPCEGHETEGIDWSYQPPEVPNAIPSVSAMAVHSADTVYLRDDHAIRRVSTAMTSTTDYNGVPVSRESDALWSVSDIYGMPGNSQYNARRHLQATPDGDLIVNTGSGLVRLDRGTGQVVWQNQVPRRSVCAPPGRFTLLSFGGAG